MRVSSFVVRRPSVVQTVVRPSVVVVRRSSRAFVVCRPSPIHSHVKQKLKWQRYMTDIINVYMNLIELRPPVAARPWHNHAMS